MRIRLKVEQKVNTNRAHESLDDAYNGKFRDAELQKARSSLINPIWT